MALNRLALAAALLEYDNDNPAAGLGIRSARESVIIRGAVLAPQEVSRSRSPSPSPSDRGALYQTHDGPAAAAAAEEVEPVEREHEEQAGEADLAEIDLASWDLPSSFIARPPAVTSTSSPSITSTSTSTIKPALTPLDRRALRKGRTVSFHGFPPDDPVEELGDAPPHHHEVEDPIRERPRSSASASGSIMARGRPTSPFRRDLTEEPLQATDVPLPASPYTAPRTSIAAPDEDYPEEPNGTMNPFAVPPPAGPRLSRFDPKATTTPSPLASPPPRPHRPTHAEGPPHHAPLSPTRLRPRTLIMPTPLQGTHDPHNSAPRHRWDTASFTHGAKPLPPGALTRPDSFVGRLGGDVFRMSLVPPGDAGQGWEMPRAAEEGEVAVRQVGGDEDWEEEEEEEEEAEEEEWDPEGWRPETRSVAGPSLMDRLEARKRELKGKNRQFRGDNRPAMMSRPSGPLIDLDSTPRDGPTALSRPGLPRGKSVFGVDTVWERDMQRLEALRAEEARVAVHEGGKTARKKDKQKSGVAVSEAEESVHPHTETLLAQGRDDTHVPPSLSLGDLSAALAPEPHKNVTVDEWAAGSEEEQQSGMEPRRRKRRTVKTAAQLRREEGEDSSEDEVPLARAFGITTTRRVEDDSSEDEPLVNLKSKASRTTLDPSDEDDIPLVRRRAAKVGPPAPPTNPDMDEDDMPLAQRRLRAQQSSSAMDPGMDHHMAMAMAQQQQQQSMMMGPMSMYAGGMPIMPMGMGMPVGMGMGMGMPLGMPAAPGFPGSPYPVPQAALDPKIDQWRRDVGAREGSIASVPPSIVTSGGRS
ncbi:hypothetical protein NliqN6_3373 [Naganishia liquefaciens]|uniref:Uncharacterized protein n=1 Tax=Naganishia liquefaciens TaxID=104408 RepID=A0A8H3TT24_9TREE|nr:hypothetical protein NliqN6_3373 [Naganishia liquefaciens]